MSHDWEEKLLEKKLLNRIREKENLELDFKNERDAHNFLDSIKSGNIKKKNIEEYFLTNRISFVALNEFCLQLISNYKYLKSINLKNTIQEKIDEIEELDNKHDIFHCTILSWTDILLGYYINFEIDNSIVNTIGWDGISLIDFESYKFGNPKYYKYASGDSYYETTINFKSLNLAVNPSESDLDTFLNSFYKEDLFKYFESFVPKKSISKKDFIQCLREKLNIKDLNNYGIEPGSYFKFLNYEHLFSLEVIKLHKLYYLHKIALAGALNFVIEKYILEEKSLHLALQWKKDNFYYLRWTLIPQ